MDASANRPCLIRPLTTNPYCKGVSLRLESLTRLHFEAMLLAASDPLIWAGHPSADRYKPEVFEPYLETLLATERRLP
jgi:hypothetical protein